LLDALLSVYEYGSYHPEITEERSFKQSTGLPFLTKREKEFLTLTCAELKMEDIAINLGIHLRTVEHYRDNVYKKLCVNNKADLIFYVKRTGLVFMK
jgi:two-component system invasion response regulator UvrY